ncbi:MAG: OmpA family protein [Myxococcales bacterium]|nr:OmpA family protein [Myxococcales bacterium]
MKRTAAALAAGLLPCLLPSPAGAVELSMRAAVAPEEAEADDAPQDEEAGADSAEDGAGSEEAAEPPKPQAPEPPADAGAKAGGSVSLGGGGAKAEGEAKGKKRRRGGDEDAEVDPDDPKAYEKAKAMERPWIRRWEPARNLAELGVFGGVLRVSDEHDLYDPITRPQDPLWQAGPDVGLRAAFFPLKPLGVEAEFSANPTRVRTQTNDFAFVYGFRGHVILQMPLYRIVPFLLGGYGLMGVRSNILVLGNDVDPAFHYGAGVKMYVTKRLVARVEGRQIVSAAATQVDSGTFHYQFLAGVSLVLGRKRPVPPPKVEPVDPDRDKDGILNESDECPDQPGPEPSGCPDTDGDGFIDKVDACIEVPGVEPDGCPLKDSDGDKILDVEDDCVFEPETYNGIDDDDGCPDDLPPELIVFKGELEGIEFDFGKATIRPESRPVLDDVVAKLKKFPGLRVLIVGHTDNVGDPETNLQLSRRRADAVKQYLVDGGIDESRIETDGKGDTEPVDTNETEAGRAKNRRIVFDIIANEPTEVRPLSKEAKDPDAKVIEPTGGDSQ